MKNISFLFLLLLSNILTSQTIPVGQQGNEELLRTLQLTGKIDAAQSLTARPFFYSKSVNANEFLNLIDSGANLKSSSISYLNNQIQFSILPASITTKFNSHHPYGWNDAGMIMAKGLQTMVSAGVYAKAGPLTIQLQPEYYYATNSNYATTTEFGYNSGKVLSIAYLGQSAIRLNLGPVSLGVSSENLWWGPGQFSSLMMSNNAPGFQHLTFNTTRPLKTPIGSFEWQLIAGKLEEDTSAAFENYYMKPLLPKNEWRFLNAIVITYQPKFLPNFFLGLTRSEHLYQQDQKLKTGFVKKYLPVFEASSPVANANSSSIPSDGAFSFFTRWIVPKHQAEFYAEFGYNDFKQNLRDLAVNSSHSAAYILGAKKIIVQKNNRLIDFAAEITQMTQSATNVLRNAGNWYEHGGVTQGLSYQNQNLGAGSGFGNNVQTLQVKKIQGFNILGIKLQRIQQDPKGFKGPSNLLAMRPIQWNDIALGFLGQHRFNKLLINGEMQLVHSKNYGWEQGNAFNVFVQCKASYFF